MVERWANVDTGRCVFITGFNGCWYKLLLSRPNQCESVCRWLSLTTLRTRWQNMTVTSKCGHALETCQPDPTLVHGNETHHTPSCYTFSLKYGKNVIGFTSPTNQAQPSKCFMSLYIEEMRRETIFYIRKALSRHHLPAEACGQACFIAGHWGQQPCSTICV